MLRSSNCKARENRCKMDIGENSMDDVTKHSSGREHFLITFYRIICFISTNSERKMNSPENTDQKIQSHPFLFLSLPSKLQNLAYFVFRAVNIMFFPVLISSLDVETAVSSPILDDHQMFMPEIRTAPYYSQ